MEKISKEDLKEIADIRALSDDEVEKIAGGMTPNECYNYCHNRHSSEPALGNCLNTCY